MVLPLTAYDARNRQMVPAVGQHCFACYMASPFAAEECDHLGDVLGCGCAVQWYCVGVVLDDARVGFRSELIGEPARAHEARAYGVHADLGCQRSCQRFCHRVERTL